jgi:threonyl-tRNA synthetase
MTPSYRDLPIRLADFSPLHRDEIAGALSGLTRLRKFCQDDAHIFCRDTQIAEEMKKCLKFVQSVYDLLGFESYRIVLSTRPSKYMGDLDLWNQAEDALRTTLSSMNLPVTINEGDGAFYGPKLDVMVTDVMKREHQCGTIQLDFQLPKNFDLSYASESGEKVRPVIIHRAILGSVERMLAILIEHTGGKWPFWLSPRQISICTVSQDANEYAEEIYGRLRRAGYYVELSLDGETIQKKIRNAQEDQYNYILVIGKTELENRTVNVRTRDNQVRGEMKLSDLELELKELSVAQA